ncbi:stage II sporulation protein D [Beduini massiliensis]|uniref:stage II sporulation protein D n=1 Tax=Beduini massiliensis TaxID=1585974 RepID=UPI0018CF95D8|nr:stage II sporulation protein D [Beduini massiliensis]
MRLGALALLFAWINYSLYLKPDKSHAKEPDIQQLSDSNDKTALPSEYQVEVTQKDGSVQYLALDDYLVGVVAGEMPLSFEDEALKAQTVASRTFAFSRGLKVDTTTNTQVYLTVEQMKNNWKDEFEQKYERLKNIVSSTHNVVMKYNNNYISALFFSSSNGKTENSEDYFASSSVPYLRSVDSTWELSICPNIERTMSFTAEQMKAAFNQDIEDIHIVSHYDSGRVKEVSVNDQIYSGREIRELLNLASTDFKISYDGDQYTFNTVGFGHGVGMSQYGANGMAMNGYDYEEILAYYYQNVEICKL